ncbi:MAG: energy transducer TonB [Nitrospinae bacterium]|nr:energy transducer TonB [Nitrospinota bacterium]
MKRVKAVWFPAAAVSLAVHCAVFGCAAWALGAKKDYLPTEVYRFREAPMAVRRAAPVSHTSTACAPVPPPKPAKPLPKPEPAPVKPEPVEPIVAKAEPPAPQPETPPAPEVVAQNAPPAPRTESLPPGPAYQETEQLSNLPYFRTNVKPVYPRTALRSGRKARVVVEVFINEKGGVDDVRIAQSGGEDFDAAVIAALKQSQFEPGYISGRPVAVRVRIPFNFRVG